MGESITPWHFCSGKILILSSAYGPGTSVWLGGFIPRVLLRLNLPFKYVTMTLRHKLNMIKTQGMCFCFSKNALSILAFPAFVISLCRANGACVFRCVAPFGAAHFLLKMEEFEMPLTEEYTQLFNTVTDTITTLEKLIYELRLAQMNAEEKYLSEEKKEMEQ